MSSMRSRYAEDNVVIIIDSPQKFVVDLSLVFSREFRSIYWPLPINCASNSSETRFTDYIMCVKSSRIKRGSDAIASDYGNLRDVLSVTSNFRCRQLYLADNIEIFRRLVSRIVFETNIFFAYYHTFYWTHNYFYNKNLVWFSTCLLWNICSNHTHFNDKKLLSRVINTHK